MKKSVFLQKIKPISRMFRFSNISFAMALLVIMPHSYSYAQSPNKVALPDKKHSFVLFERPSAAISPRAGLVLGELKKPRKASKLFYDCGFAKNQTLDSNSLMSVFLQFEPSVFNTKKLEALGGLLGTQMPGLLTAQIPVANLEAISQLDGLIDIQPAKRVHKRIDRSRLAAQVDPVHLGSGLPSAFTGLNTVVGVIDLGFDYTHPAFRSFAGGSTPSVYRIKRVWNQQDIGSGTPPTGYNYGRHYTSETAILARRNDNDGVESQGSHGTHVTSIAAGGGDGTSASMTNTYRGAAPQADIVAIGLGGIDAGVVDGAAYVFNYAQSVGKPAVVNMSLGTHTGPHDGTSLTDLGFASLAGNGRLLVGAAGNEGSRKLYVRKVFTATDTVLFTFVRFENENPVTAGSANIDIWGSPGTKFRVAVNVFNLNATSSPFEDYTPYISTSSNQTYIGALSDNDFFADSCHVGISVESANPRNNKPHAQVEIDHTEQDDSYRWALLEITGKNTTVEFWSDDADFSRENRASPLFVAGTSTSTVGEIGGVSPHVITVGAFVSKTSYLNSQGSTIIEEPANQLGRLASFSSFGPTADGRIKPDITAGGHTVVSAFSRFDPEMSASSDEVVRNVTFNSQTYRFGAYSGTSMSSPLTAGILALWLQADPQLNITKIKQILAVSAIRDAQTGTIPAQGNNSWGQGKINALEGIKRVLLSTSAKGKTGSAGLYANIYPNPAQGYTSIELADPSAAKIEIYNLQGSKVAQYQSSGSLQTRVDLSGLANGTYMCVVWQGAGKYVGRLVVNK